MLDIHRLFYKLKQNNHCPKLGTLHSNIDVQIFLNFVNTTNILYTFVCLCYSITIVFRAYSCFYTHLSVMSSCLRAIKLISVAPLSKNVVTLLIFILAKSCKRCYSSLPSELLPFILVKKKHNFPSFALINSRNFNNNYFDLILVLPIKLKICMENFEQIKIYFFYDNS